LKKRRCPLKILSFLALLFVIPFQVNAGLLNGFEVKDSLVPLEEITPGGPSQRGILAINNPTFITAAAARENHTPMEQAIIVENKGIVKAYPISILNWHQVVNDRIGGRPIVVTYCPLSATPVVFDPRVDAQPLLFGVSGLLYQSDVLIYDGRSKSLWSQLMRKAITGSYKGEKLVVVPSSQKNLHKVLDEYPHAQVMGSPGNSKIRKNYKVNPYAAYERSKRVDFPVKHIDRSIPQKTFAILLLLRDHSLIVPVNQLDSSKKQLDVILGNKNISISYNFDDRTIFCETPTEGLTCIRGYWFALKTFYPQAKVYMRPTTTTLPE
jgi:hypothetical protein